jgi:predicted DNA-binding transcriptional regulator AlpA
LKTTHQQRAPCRSRFIDYREIERRGITKSQLENLINKHAFPKGCIFGTRSRRWDESEVDRWVEAAPKSTRQAPRGYAAGKRKAAKQG